MNNQEAIEKLESRAFDIEDTDLVVGLSFAKHTINHIDESEKVVVPPYIDTWIQGAKYNGFDLYEAMFDNELIDKANMWIENNSETFAKAWIYGYKVEKEKLYTVELPNPNRADVSLVLGVYNSGKVAMFANYTDNWKYKEQYQLTEAEIKKDFDWAWQFAEEVKK